MASAPIRRETKKRGVWYQVRWEFNGRWQQVDEVGHADALLAQAWVSNVMRNQIESNKDKVDPRIKRREYLNPVAIAEATRSTGNAEDKTFREVVDEWFTTKTVAASTEKNNRSKLKHFAAWNDMSVGLINHHVLNARYRELLSEYNEFCDGPIYKSTAEGIMATVCEVLNYAFGEEYTKFSARGARAAKKFAFKAPTLNKSAARNSFTKAQILALLAALPTVQDRLIVRFMIATGGRIGEVMALNVEDVDIAGGVVIFANHMVSTKRMVGTKGTRGGEVGPAYEVVMDTKLWAEMAEFIKGRRHGEPLWIRTSSGRGRRAVSPYLCASTWRTNVFNVAVARLMESGALTRKATPHWTRHTTGSWGRTKLPSRLLSDHMRHVDTRTTALYEHKSAADVATIRTALDEVFDDVA